MGYRSDVVFAVDKLVLAHDLIEPILPDVLRTHPHFDTDRARYWHFDSWKWYQTYKEVSGITDFIELLDEIEIPAAKDMSLYGGARIGEEMDDFETWGEPWEFDIHISRTIESPVPPF